MSSGSLIATKKYLDDLPLELRVIILSLSHDVKTLSAAVHSSSTFHTPYTLAHERIFTAITLRELEQRSVNFEKPCYSMDLDLQDKAMKNNIMSGRPFWRDVEKKVMVSGERSR